MAGLIANVKAGARDGLDAWGAFASVAPAALRLAALPMLAVPAAGVLGLLAAGVPGMALGLVATVATAFAMLAYASHLRTQGLTPPPVLGVYGKPYFWSFMASGIAVLVLQALPAFAAVLFVGVVGAAGFSTVAPDDVGDATVLMAVGAVPLVVVASVWLFARLSLALPATAERGELSLSEGWAASKGRAVRVLVAATVASLPVGIADSVLKAVLPPEVAGILSLMLTVAQVVVVSSALSLVWMALRPKRGISRC